MIPFWRDKYFVLALLAGPTLWVGLFMAGFHRIQETALGVYLVLPILVYPLIEEWFFRGTLQPAIAGLPGLGKRWRFMSFANVLTSLIFASMHLISQPTIWAFAVFFPSLVFGWSIERFQTLAAPVTLHIFYNAGFFLLF